MSDRYEPFSPARIEALGEALRAPVIRDIEGLASLRAEVSGARSPLAGLSALLEGDPQLGERFFTRMLPSLLRAARELVTSGIPSLPVHAQGTATRSRLPRSSVPGWIAHILLGTLPPPSPDHPCVDALLLLRRTEPQELAKLHCILELFDRTADGTLPGTLTIERRVAPPRTAKEWETDRSPLPAIEVRDAEAIEDAELHLQVDFANRFLGGGVLSGGCVQEEIRFAVAPELLVAMICSPRMEDGEAILVHGAERLAQTRGYAFKLQYAGSYQDCSPRLPDGTPDVSLVAIDALDFRRADSSAQYTERFMLRELRKASAGFSSDERGLRVATGNWGGGVFLGDPALKAVLQWLAASACGRAVRYHPFGDPRVAGLASFAGRASARFGSVGALWARLLEVMSEAPGGPIFDRILGR